MNDQPKTHVAILREPYISLVLSGEKTIEARLTKRMLPPYGVTTVGDWIYIKRSGGLYAAMARAGAVAEFDLAEPHDVDLLRARYESSVQGGELFWLRRANARFATFITLDAVRPCAEGPDLSSLPPGRRRLAWHTFAAGAEAGSRRLSA